jgi:integrase
VEPQNVLRLTEAAPVNGKPPRRSAKGSLGYYVVHRAHGRWTGYAWDPYKRKYQGKSFDLEREAADWAAFRHAEFKTGQAKAGRSPMREVADEYLAELTLHSASEGHMEFCRHVIDRSIEAGVTDLNSDSVVSVARQLLIGLTKRGSTDKASSATKNNFIKILRAIGNFAVRHRYVRENHFERMDYVPVAVPLKAVFELEELGRLVDPKHKSHPFYPVFAMQIYTGFRPREVRWVDYDWILWDSMRLAMKIGEFLPKGHRERRARITRFMEEHADVMKDQKNAHGPVFPDLRKATNAKFQSRFNNYLVHCGVSVGERTPHSTRHTWTCLMLASGENEMLVQQYAGHSQKEMTAYYAREQDRYRRQVEKAKWPRGELRLRDFTAKGN